MLLTHAALFGKIEENLLRVALLRHAQCLGKMRVTSRYLLENRCRVSAALQQAYYLR